MHAAQIILILILLLILILILLLVLILILILSRFLGTPQTIFNSGSINCWGGGVGHIKAGPTLVVMDSEMEKKVEHERETWSE